MGPSGRHLLTLGLPLAALAVQGCASFWLLYPGVARANDPHLDPRADSRSYQSVSVINAQGNRLAGWLFAEPRDYGTALVAGGNAQNVSSTYGVSRYLTGNGFRVLVFTYQGFDANQGRAELTSLVGDASAFYAFVRSRYGGEPIAFVGYSTGAVTGICVADRAPLAAVVAEGSFNPKTIIEDKHLWIAMPLNSMFKSSVPDELDTSRCLRELKAVPILFVHNPKDRLAPYDAARRLFDGYRGPKQFVDTKYVPGSDAHFGSTSDPEARAAVLAFVREHLARR